MDINNKVENFLIKSKSIIASYFYKKNNNKLELKNVYPVIFDNVEIYDFVSSNNIQKTISFYYDELIPEKLRKDYGQFYTNNTKLIDCIVNKLDLMSGKILEPSCGSGYFLVSIVSNIIEKLSLNKKSNEIIEYIQNNIYGNDIDENACRLTEVNIILEMLPIIIDAVNCDKNFKMNRLNISNFDFVSKKGIFEGFSIVVGNPPYVTMYGKRSRNMTEERRKYYNTFDFVQNKNGNNKFNMAMFFVENGLKALKNNGKLIYILDISFFETAYIDLRKYILENYHISSITSGLQEFEGVASGQLLLDIDKMKILNSSVNWIDYHSNEISIVNQKNWLEDKPKFRILKPLNAIEDAICKKMEFFEKLDFYYPSKSLRTCCALTGKTECFIVDPNKETKHIVLPYLEGSKGLSKKFGSLKPSFYIKYDYELQIKLSDEFKEELEAIGVKNKKRVTLGDKDAYLAPKIFIRQSATELIASYTEKPFASNNSIYILTNKENSLEERKKLKYMCAILNSDLLSYYALVKKIIRIEKGKTPQIKVSDLKELRINFSKLYFDELINLVDSIYEIPSEYNELLKKINDIVYSIYGISNEEIIYIENYLKKF